MHPVRAPAPWMLLLALSAAPALAADIRVETNGTAWVYVDGRLLEYPPDGADALEIKDLAAGPHDIVVRNWLGKKVATHRVELPVDGTATLSYAKKQLTVLFATEMPKPEGAEVSAAEALAEELGEGGEPPAEGAEGAEGGEPGAEGSEATAADGTAPTTDGAAPAADGTAPTTDGSVVTAVVVDKAPEEAPAPAAILPGSIEITGLPKETGRVWVDEQQLLWFEDLKSFVAVQLAPGMHQVRVGQGNKLAFAGELEVKSDANHQCLISEQGGELGIKCQWKKPALGPKEPSAP